MPSVAICGAEIFSKTGEIFSWEAEIFMQKKRPDASASGRFSNI